MIDLPGQPLGYVEPDYDGIEGLAWAWCGGSDHVEKVVSGISPYHGLFSGWATNYTAGDGLAGLYFTPDRPVPTTNANDFALEYIGEYINRESGSNAAPFLIVGNGTVPLGGNCLGFGIGASTGSIQMVGPTSGFQTVGSGLSPSTGFAHYICSRYRGRYFHYLKRYATGIITRNLDVAPPSSNTSWSGTPTIMLLKNASDTFAISARIAKAAVYTRGLTEAEAEDLLAHPWSTFLPKRPRQRLTTILETAVSGFNPAWAQNSNRFIGSGIHVS